VPVVPGLNYDALNASALHEFNISATSGVSLRFGHGHLPVFLAIAHAQKVETAISEYQVKTRTS